jgi:hypothetical protein
MIASFRINMDRINKVEEEECTGKQPQRWVKLIRIYKEK